MSYYADARARARRRKSPWNLLLILFVPTITGVLLWLSFNALWALHVLAHPAHAGQEWLFWNGRPSNPITFAAGFAMLFGPAFPCLIAAMVLSNFLIRCIGPARRALDREAEQVRGTDY